MPRIATIELFKEYMNFSVGHFTIFSHDTRENLHGHNYHLYVSIKTYINDDGLSFNYRYYKEKFHELCRKIDETVLLAGNCKHLTITENEKYYVVQFNNEELFFLKRDATVLPISNVTVEELSNWFIGQITKDEDELEKNSVMGLTVKIFSGAGQSGATSWEKSK